MKIEYLGNEELLKERKTAFLAPRRIAPEAVMPSYDWAVEMARRGECVISGFASPVERDVWDFLVGSGTQPVILVSVRSKFARTPVKYRRLLAQGRLLIIFLGLGSRQSAATAAERNRYVAELADRVVIPSLHEASSLCPLCQAYGHKTRLLCPAQITDLKSNPYET